MPKIDLETLLDLVGELKDSSEPNSASARFRTYLQKNVQTASELRDYVEFALRKSGDQYNKALQDLINHLGQCLGFDVTYGRYRGVRGEIGFDGLWQSPADWSLVVEAKTTDVYTVKTSTLLGYMNDLVSEGRIKHPNNALGLYVYGRFDTHTSQLENAITVEGRRDELRVVSVAALLNLLELKQEYGLSHRTILRLLLPAPVRIDPLVNLISDIVAQEKEEGEAERDPRVQSVTLEQEPTSKPEPSSEEEVVRVTLHTLEENFTGQSAVAFNFDGERYEVHTWKEIAVKLFEILWERDRQGFEEAARVVRGRTRPYITRDESQLRSPEPIPNTDLYFEANISANYIAKLCYTLVEQMGFSSSVFRIEAEA